MPRHCPSRSPRYPSPLPISSRRPRRVTRPSSSGRKPRQPLARTGQAPPQQFLAMTDQPPRRRCLAMMQPGTGSRPNNLPLLPRRMRRSLPQSSSGVAPGGVPTGKRQAKRAGGCREAPQVPRRGGPRAIACKEGTDLPKERTRRPHDRSNRALSFLKCRFSDRCSDCLLASALVALTRP